MKKFVTLFIVILFCAVLVCSCGETENGTTIENENELFDKTIAYSKVVYGDAEYDNIDIPSCFTIIEKHKSVASCRFENFYNKKDQLVYTSIIDLTNQFFIQNILPNSVRIIEYNEKGKFEKGEFNGSTLLFEYDENGNLIKIIKDGKATLVCEYNDKNLVVKRTENIEDVPDRYYTYEYDENDNITKISKYDPETNRVEYINEYKFSAQGLLLEQTITQNSSSYTYYGRTVYEYDSDNLKAKETTYNENGDIEDYTIYEYEGKKLVKKSCYNGKDELNKYYVYKYSNNGLSESYYDSHNNESEGLSLSRYAEYDKNSALIKYYEEFENDVPVDGYDYEYNASGNLIGIKSLNNSVESYELDYNEKDQVTKVHLFIEDSVSVKIQYQYSDDKVSKTTVYGKSDSLIKETDREMRVYFHNSRKTPALSFSYYLDNKNSVIESYYLETNTISVYEEYTPDGFGVKRIQYSKDGEITFQWSADENK